MNKAPISNKLLDLVKECINEAAAPNSIEEIVYEKMVDDFEPGCLTEDVATAVSNLVSLLVKDAGQYM